MNSIIKRISNLITDNLSSLVKFTGLLVSIGVLVLLCSCGDEGAVLYESAPTEETGATKDPYQNPTDTGDSDTLKDANIPEISNNSENLNTSAYIEAVTTGLEEDVSATIIVHVCGAVNNPGVYEIEGTSRVVDAINMAGGFGADACVDAINLAAGINDGSKIYVPTEEEMLEGAGLIREDNLQFIENSSEAANMTLNVVPGDDAKININTASKESLMTLSGIGETRADAIIAYREENGAFKSIEDIMNVSGIKSGSFDKIKDKITVR